VTRLGAHIVVAAAAVAAALVAAQLAAQRDPRAPGSGYPPAGPAITIDDPPEGSIFPPDMAAPTFAWRDAAPGAAVWRIEVAFAGGSAGIRVKTNGARLSIGEIDPCCLGIAGELPTLTPQQAAAWSWKPDPATWAAIRQRSVERPATVTITGFRKEDESRPVSRGQVTIQTSKDPVGAPIFFRDVPLRMPGETKKGIMAPLAPSALPLIGWRLRSVGEPRSRLVLTGLYVCANCHSFSADGKTLAMDLDGPANDKGLYSITPVKPRMSIGNQNVVEWSSFREGARVGSRVGFMSRISPDGQYIVTSVNRTDYVLNYEDYHFLQTSYPTRGVLAWYNRATGEMHTLPGADDPHYVHTDPVWTPDGEYVVFARAEAKESYPEGRKLAEFANDPNETPIQYDLCRIPFNHGKGGRAEPIVGASRNGMSNNFPRVSPDGRWVVYVECHNGQLLRPDSQLYIVPLEGGQARRMRCNTPLMNSWHSFSPNGRWLVFSSKSRTPYTQMFLTHLDDQGNDSPAILIENATAANRAVNLPEFVNIPPDGLLKIDVPAAEFYRLSSRAMESMAAGRYEQAVGEWTKALEVTPDDVKANDNLGLALAQVGRIDDALKYFQKAVEIDPRDVAGHNNLAGALRKKGRINEAIAHWTTALELNPRSAAAHNNLGDTLYGQGRHAEAVAHWRAGLRAEPDRIFTLNQLAWVLATCAETAVRNGAEAVGLAERAVQLSGGRDPAVLSTLAAAYAETSRFPEAADTARRALNLALSAEQKNQPLIGALKAGVALYQAGSPYREVR